MPTAPGGYSALRCKPNAVPLFGWSVLARFQFGVIPLALLLLLSTERHSYAEAGAVTAGYALSAGLLGPVRSRYADRYGHGRLLVVFAGLNAAGLMLVAVLASAPWLLLLFVAILAGCLPPPVGPVMRSTWRVLADGEQQLRAAYSLDAVSEEVLFVVGPLVAAAGVARSSASAVLAASALGLLVAALGLWKTLPGRGPLQDGTTAETGGRNGGRWRSTAFLAGLAPAVAIGLLLGAFDLSVIAAAVHSTGEAAGGAPAATAPARRAAG